MVGRAGGNWERHVESETVARTRPCKIRIRPSDASQIDLWQIIIIIICFDCRPGYWLKDYKRWVVKVVDHLSLGNEVFIMD